MSSDDVLVGAYWDHHRLSVSDVRAERLTAANLFDAWEEVEAAVRDDDRAVPLLVALASAAPDDEALAHLGAGPIEDLILSASSIVLDRIEGAAQRNERFRLALRCAWFDNHVPPDVAARLRRFGSPL